MIEETVAPNVRKETSRIKMIFELTKDLQEDEVVCEYCHGTGLQIADNVYGIKGDTTHIGTHFPYKHQSLTFCKYCHNGVQKKCPDCGGLSKKTGLCPCGHSARYMLSCEKKINLERWEKSEKLPVAKAFEKYNALYIDNLDQYAYTPDELNDLIEEYEADRSSLRIYATFETKIEIDAYYVIKDACDELHEEAAENCDADSLQKLLNNWCADQTGTISYYPDYSVGVILAEENSKINAVNNRKLTI